MTIPVLLTRTKGRSYVSYAGAAAGINPAVMREAVVVIQMVRPLLYGDEAGVWAYRSG